LLWAAKDFTAIDQWEKGIEVDPVTAATITTQLCIIFLPKTKCGA
jgi:hypothetical protein